MADPNQINLEAFHQELHESAAPRNNKRRSSILKAVDNNLPEDRRQSRRISFHTNILCQQILPDGTTQVITEALKAKLPDSSVSTVSDESRPSLPDKTGDENISRKRSTTAASNCASGVKKRKDPKIVAQSYQNFIKRTYDEKNENDYDTVFNTSVNRNGFQVAPRHQRLDVTKLFAVDQTEGVMDITKVLHAADESHIQNENDVTGVSATRIFSDFSMSLEDSLNDANASEMDTAMIIDENLFETSDEKDSVKEMPADQVAEDESGDESDDSADLSDEPEVAVVSDPEAAVVILNQEAIADVSMSIVSDAGDVASQEPAEKTKVFEDCGMEVTEAVDGGKLVEVDGEKTQVFSQGASIAIEKNLSKDISPPSSQEPVPVLSNKSLVAHKEDDLFQDKSASFKNNRALTLAFSRVSFPRNPVLNLDKVLKLRRQQMDETLQTLKNADISSDVDSYSDSPHTSIQNNDFSAVSVHVPEAKSIVFEKTSLLTQNMETSSVMDVSAGSRVSETCEPAHLPAVDDEVKQAESQRHISPSSESSGFLAPSTQSSGTSSQETDDRSDGSRKTASTKRSSDSHFLSSTMGFTSLDESGSESGDVSCFEESLNAGSEENGDEDEDGNDLHDDSLFENCLGAESSFIISPDSSFHSSFICQDDTLLVLGDDIDAKLNQFVQDNNMEAEAGQHVVEENRDLTFVPLRTFEAERNSVTLLTHDPNRLVALFMFATIRLTIDLGTTLRSFNGIPIKVIKRIGIESAMKDPDFVFEDDGKSLIDYSDEKIRVLLAIAHDMLISSFEQHKSSLISKYSTSDQLSDVLNEISDLVKEGEKFLQELALTSLLYPMQVYRKIVNVYELAFQLPGRRRNFFLVLSVDPSSYPFMPMRVRFGFDPTDESLYHVKNFAKALSLVVKPGKNYISRMIDAAKKYVLISRKISRANN